MGGGVSNWYGIIHRQPGVLVGVSARFHFGAWGVDTVDWTEIPPSEAAAIKYGASQSDTATVNAVMASGWASDWTATATALSNAGAPAGVLPTAVRDWMNHVSF